jgi:uncharacterized protein (UPF0305 family)
MPLFRRPEPARSPDSADTISRQCSELKAAATRGELGTAVARIVLLHSPQEIQQMKRNFDTRVQDLSPEYRDRLSAKITEHLLGTFQRIRLDHQQGTLKTRDQTIPDDQRTYWDMVRRECSGDGEADAPALRFLKYLLAGYCMLVLDEPGHPAGTPFPGGDEVEFTDGVYYCPVRAKEAEVDSALCPFCPAKQTPSIGYLRPATKPTERNRQEFIDNCYRHHNFNG